MSTPKNNPKSPNAVAQNLPQERDKRGLRPVRKPLETTRLSRLIYTLIVLTALLATYYSYRTVQYKIQVGNWWNMALGRKPPAQQAPVGDGTSRRDSVEDKINDLAKGLGIPSRDLASAIAVAVRNYVPPASLSSIAARETGPAIQALLKEPSRGDRSPTVTAEAGFVSSTGIFSEVVDGINKFVGMDEP